MYDNSGIYVRVSSPDTQANSTNPAPGLSSFDDLRIENNYIHDLSTEGIYFNGSWGQWGEAQKPNPTFDSWYTNIKVRHNTVKNTGGDGIVIGYSVAPLLEYNTVTDIGVNGTNHQYIAGLWI